MKHAISDWKKTYQTDYLLGKSGFLQGMGSVLSLRGNHFAMNFPESGDEADKMALESDWGMIGLDIAKTTEEYRKSHTKPRVSK